MFALKNSMLKASFSKSVMRSTQSYFGLVSVSMRHFTQPNIYDNYMHLTNEEK